MLHLYLHSLLRHCFCFFHQKIYVFIIFFSFFDEVSNSISQKIKQNIDQLETVIGDKKLSVGRYVTQAAFSFP